MPAFAPAALATAVVLSALGAVVLCVLVMLYGFTAGDEESSERATRRLLLTRVGHSLAAACFTATAILIATVLVVQRAPSPSPVAAPMPAPDTRVPALGEKLAGQETRLSETEARIRELEDALRRREAAPVRPALEEPVPTPPTQRPAATRPSPPAPARPGPRTSARPIREMAASEPPAPAASPPTTRAGEPPTPEPPRPSAPIITPAPAPSPPMALVPPRAKPPEAAPAPSASRQAPRRPLDVPNRLRDDWREIQRGVDSAGDDFRSAVDDLKRRLLGN
jgi:hypothetical protein